MVSQKVVLTTSKTLVLELDSSKVEPYLPPCSLQWRDKTLWVKAIQDSSQDVLPALKRREWLKDCLQNSIVEQVCLDSGMEKKAIKLWAKLCRECNKPVFLVLPSQIKALSDQKPIYWNIKRLMDWLVAAILLLLLSPVMLILAAVIKILTPKPVFLRQWRVGNQGQLFEVYKFRTIFSDGKPQPHPIMGDRLELEKLEKKPPSSSLGEWLRKYSLDKLPLLFNVLRGEMSLVGPRPWGLYNSLRPQKLGHTALPGLTGAWQIARNSHLLDWDAVTQWDLNYLNSWSLGQDLKIILMTIPKVIFGSVLTK
ncbi:MAG: sugar transferase [Xenococcaceae cyanobacterium MO_207.B15]|nr:sugar transferase [Xenococcaceae cyanobacterium MO_207.B15]